MRRIIEVRQIVSWNWLIFLESIIQPSLARIGDRTVLVGGDLSVAAAARDKGAYARRRLGRLKLDGLAVNPCSASRTYSNVERHDAGFADRRKKSTLEEDLPPLFA